jgi:Ca2+-transporting ATPase
MSSYDSIESKGNSWHSIQVNEAIALLASSSQNGLSVNEVLSRQKQYGLNELPKKKIPSFLIIFLRQFKSPLIYLLLVAAGIAFGVGHNVDAQVILVVLMTNALIGSFQERRAQISMEALRKMTHTIVKVLRNQQEELIDSKELVPGDILLLNEGDAVGADARLINVSSLQTSEASLTGESMPIWKIASLLVIETTLADRTNMVYAGTHIVKGNGKALVVATGIKTEIGQIAALTQATKKLITPLEERIARFSKHVLIAAFLVFTSVVLIGVIQKLNFSTIFMVALSQVVSMVPEGLPVAVTVALAVGMQRMARRGAIVRKLDAVETLGSINVICTDKTGTLTRNEMTVTEIMLSQGRRIKVTGAGYSPIGEFIENEKVLTPALDRNLVEFFTAAVLCNDAKFILNTDGSPSKNIGDPTEVSLLSLVQKGGLLPEKIRGSFTRLGEIPFDSETKMMAVLVKGDGAKKIYIKGAPEAILELCSTMRDEENNIPLDLEIINRMQQEEISMAARALRLLAFAVIDNPTIDLTGGWKSLKGYACFLGITGQFDPPRSEARAAVHACRSAGIRPIIVTGDHKVTGLAVAKILNIAVEGDIAIDGQELSMISDEELNSRLNHISVFARVHPAQKLRIVKAWQQNNAIVAMTGDGVNDAPALVKANVGVAMGITGTEVAKEAAKIVITDDNFATIVLAVEEGRIVFRNLKKLLLYLISTGLTELVVLYTALIFGLPLPLAAVQILWINLITDGVLSLPMILEPSEGDEMKYPPISRDEPLINRQILKRMAFMIPAMATSTIFYYIYRLSSDIPFAQVQTGTFTVLAVCQWFNALNCRSEKRSAFKGLLTNRWLLFGLLIGNFLHMGVVFLPPLNRLFHTVPMPISEVFLIGSVASLVLWVEELRKVWMRYMIKHKKI